VGKIRACAGVVQMTGPDTRMDQLTHVKPANPLPVKCAHCTMPDLDFVATPYLLVKGFAAPAETAPAEVGNFLVRDRVRKILELVVPGACRFVPTAEKKSAKAIKEWWLAAPTHVVGASGLPLALHRMASKGDQRCSKCGEPSTGYYPWVQIKGKPNQYRFVGLDGCDCRGLDVFKTKYWSAIDTVENQYAEGVEYFRKRGEELPPWSNFGKDLGLKEPPHPQRWTRIHLDRDLFFSVRLEQLLKKAKVKGQLVRLMMGDNEHVQPTPEDIAWAEEQLQVLARAGLVDAKPAAAAGAKSGGADKWFGEYLKKNAAKKPPAKVDFQSIEKKQKVSLPAQYKDFMSVVGPKAFRNVMQIDGFTAKVLPPKKLDFIDYRRDKWDELGAESDVDGIAFAETDHGDVFVFETSKKKNAAVYWYNHEENTVEPFAASFAECIRRFDQST
jgi:hypothetical protein